METNTGWYWMNNLLRKEGILLSLARAKFVKAISYAKVKTNMVNADLVERGIMAANEGGGRSTSCRIAI